jgi:hypothetical protein
MLLSVESAWGAVPALLLVRFPRPLAEPAVRLSPQRALHGFCRGLVQAAWTQVGEQVVEPATGIGRRPTVKLGLHLRYPPPRTHRHVGRWILVGRGVTIRRRIFRHYSLQLSSRFRDFSKPLPPFAL